MRQRLHFEQPAPIRSQKGPLAKKAAANIRRGGGKETEREKNPSKAEERSGSSGAVPTCGGLEEAARPPFLMALPARKYSKGKRKRRRVLLANPLSFDFRPFLPLVAHLTRARGEEAVKMSTVATTRRGSRASTRCHCSFDCRAPGPLALGPPFISRRLASLYEVHARGAGLRSTTVQLRDHGSPRVPIGNPLRLSMRFDFFFFFFFSSRGKIDGGSVEFYLECRE